MRGWKHTQQVRNISVRSILSKLTPKKGGPEISSSVKTLPKTTGAGAFVHPIEYEVLGRSGDLLNIKLPKSAILNLRYSNRNQQLVAMNGKVSDLYVELGKIQSNAGGSQRLVFQRCFNSSDAMSLLFANNTHNADFSVLESKQGSDSWIVRRDSLVAWSGNHLNVDLPVVHEKLVSISGDGKFVLSSPGQMLQIQLAENEAISVNPASLVAYTSRNGETVDLRTAVRSVADLSVPRVPVLAKLSSGYNWTKETVTALWHRFQPSKTPEAPKKSSYTSLNPALEKLLVSFRSLLSHTKHSLSKLVSGSGQDYLVQLQGPRTLLVTNAIHLKDRVLTEEELAKIT